MKIQIKPLVNFLDDSKKKANSPYSNVIVQLLGEDLGAHCFRRYLDEVEPGCRITIDDSTPCKLDGPKGKQLDRWIRVDYQHGRKVDYQTEIKTWNSNGLGGIPVSLNASLDELADYGRNEWQKRWDDKDLKFRDEKVGKVLIKMNQNKLKDTAECSHEALLIYWAPIYNRPIQSLLDGSLWRHPTPKCDFSELNVFSVSTYLRHLAHDLGETTIDMVSPDFDRTRETMKHLGQILS